MQKQTRVVLKYFHLWQNVFLLVQKHFLLKQKYLLWEAEGLITRTEYKEIPPRVMYELSAKGESLKPIILAMNEWGAKNALG